MIKNITTDEIKRMSGAEGLILQGCGGDPQEWADGINDLLTQEGILLGGAKFTDISVFEHNGLTNILFRMDDMSPETLDVGKLAIWRISSHDTFAGTWLSDYRVNRLGVSNDEPEEPPLVVFGEQSKPFRVGVGVDRPQADDGEAAKDAPPLSVYIENADNERLGGFTMPLPATREALQPFLDGLEITDESQIAVMEVTSPIKGLGNLISDNPYDSLRLDELNYLAARLQALDEFGRDTFAAAVEAERHTGSVAEIINIVENIGIFDIQPAFSPKEYGDFLLGLEMDEHANAFQRVQEGDSQLSGLARYIEMLEDNFDAAAFGRKIAADESGSFTDFGYLTEQSGFKEIYRGSVDIPAEYRIFEQTAVLEGAALDTFLIKLHALAGNADHDAEAIAAVKNGASTYDFLAAANAAYMSHAACPAEAFLRITQETAKDMLARGDAKVYRLMPNGPLCLSRLSVVHNGLNFAEHREFAIRREDMAGLDKWAERAAAEVSRQRERGEQKKSHGEEL
jgi:hypothetical protein